MRFRRYTVFIYTYYIVFGLIFLLELYIFSSYAIQEERYVIIPVYILSYILFATIMYFMLRWVPESEGGHINDYIILTNDRIELHGKQAEASIDWLEVTEIREVILWRGMRKIKVIARDGRWISFESSGKWEKKIWGMYGMKYNVYPTMGNVGLKAFIASVIGGLGSVPGAIVGALLLGFIETVVSGYISSGMRDLISFSLLILILLVRPAGLFGVDVQEKA